MFVFVHEQVFPQTDVTYKFIMQEYEPFNWTENGQVYGGMYEVTKMICHRMKISCSFEALPMKRVISMLEEGSTHGVLSLIENSNRASFTILSDPIIDSKMSYFSLNDSFKKVTSLSQLKGGKVGVVETSSAEKLVEKHREQIKDLTIVPETGLQVVMNKLLMKRYGEKGLVFANEDVFRFSLRKQKTTNVKVVFSEKPEKFRIGFSKKSVSNDFVKNFNIQIKKLRKSGELSKILRSYHLKMSR